MRYSARPAKVLHYPYHLARTSSGILGGYVCQDLRQKRETSGFSARKVHVPHVDILFRLLAFLSQIKLDQHSCTSNLSLETSLSTGDDSDSMSLQGASDAPDCLCSRVGEGVCFGH